MAPTRPQHAAPVLGAGRALAEVHQRSPAAAGGLRALVPALSMAAQNWTGAGHGGPGARSVGHVQGNKLRGNVVEAWEKRQIAEISQSREGKRFDDPEVGDSVVVRYVDAYARTRVVTFGGVCIDVRKGLVGKLFTLRNHVAGSGVEQQFAYYNPHLKGIQVIKKPVKKPRLCKLYYLRDRPAKETTVKWVESDLDLGSDQKASVQHQIDAKAALAAKKKEKKKKK